MAYIELTLEEQIIINGGGSKKVKVSKHRKDFQKRLNGVTSEIAGKQSTNSLLNTPPTNREILQVPSAPRRNRTRPVNSFNHQIVALNLDGDNSTRGSARLQRLLDVATNFVSYNTNNENFPEVRVERTSCGGKRVSIIN